MDSHLSVFGEKKDNQDCDVPNYGREPNKPNPNSNAQMTHNVFTGIQSVRQWVAFDVLEISETKSVCIVPTLHISGPRGERVHGQLTSHPVKANPNPKMKWASDEKTLTASCSEKVQISAEAVRLSKKTE